MSMLRLSLVWPFWLPLVYVDEPLSPRPAYQAGELGDDIHYRLRFGTASWIPYVWPLPDGSNTSNTIYPSLAACDCSLAVRWKRHDAGLLGRSGNASEIVVNSVSSVEPSSDE